MGLTVSGESNKVLDVYSNEIEDNSIKSYKMIINYMTNATTSKGVENTEKAVEIYTDHYGGSYLDDNHILNINVVGKIDEIKNITLSIANDDTIKYHLVKNSYSELLETYNYLVSNIIQLGITKVSLSETDNIVKVYSTDLTSVKQSIHKIIDEKTYELITEDIQIQNAATYDVIAGDGIKAGSSYSSISFCVKTSNGSGIVTAAHGVGAEGSNVYLNGVYNATFGTVKKKVWQGSVDAAYVEKKDTLLNKYNLTYLLRNRETIWSWLSHNYVPEGTSITKFGITTSGTSGTILNKNTSFVLPLINKVFTDMVETSAYAQPGDSGGPVVTKLNGNNCILGIVTGITTYTNGTVRMYYCKVTNVLNDLGLQNSVILEP